jgi:hypothetical protein
MGRISNIDGTVDSLLRDYPCQVISLDKMTCFTYICDISPPANGYPNSTTHQLDPILAL